MRGEMSDATYKVLMPGPWPGPPQPFHSMQVFYHRPPWADFAAAKNDEGPSCGACPKSLYCLAGRKLFTANELHRPPSGFTICRNCSALIWYQGDVVYLCYRLAAATFAQISPEKVDFLHRAGTMNGALTYVVAATIETDHPDPDLVQRFFSNDDTCARIRQFGTCDALYHTFLKEYERNPLHDHCNPFLGEIKLDG